MNAKTFYLAVRKLVYLGIETKLTTLLSFNSIYSRPTIEDIRKAHFPGHHLFHVLFNSILNDRNREIKARKKERYTEIHQIVSSRVAFALLLLVP